MMNMIQMKDVFHCRARHAKMIRFWRQIPKFSWLLALNAACLTTLGWVLVLRLDPEDPTFSSKALASAVVMGLALVASAVALLVAWRKP